jgi:uncharacterized protein (TIGR03083 family)
MRDRDPLTALADESRTLSALLRRLSAADFERLTNCPPWNLNELVVHIAASIRLDDDALLAAPPGSVLMTAADYYRRPERDTSEYRQRNVDQTRQLARRILPRTSATRFFDEVASDTLDTLGRRDLGQPVQVPGRGPMKLADWVVTRVVSVAAHGLDVALTVDQRPWTRRSALDVMRPVLVSLLGAEPPAQLGWDAQTLLEVGTGRRELTSDERAILGIAQARFPLLS